MRRALPLLVDVLMAALASVRLHEVFRRNLAMSRRPARNWGRTGLALHRLQRPWMSGAVAGFLMAKRLLHEPRAYAAPSETTTATATTPAVILPNVARRNSAPAEEPGSQQDHGDRAHQDVRVHQVPMHVRRPGIDKRETEDRSSSQESASPALRLPDRAARPAEETNLQRRTPRRVRHERARRRRRTNSPPATRRGRWPRSSAPRSRAGQTSSRLLTQP